MDKNDQPTIVISRLDRVIQSSGNGDIAVCAKHKKRYWNALGRGVGSNKVRKLIGKYKILFDYDH